MIQDVGNFELCELRDGTQNAVHSVFIILEHWYILSHLRAFLAERRANQKFISYTMDLLSVPEYVIKKGRPHGHRYGKKPGNREDKEYLYR